MLLTETVNGSVSIICNALKTKNSWQFADVLSNVHVSQFVATDSRIGGHHTAGKPPVQVTLCMPGDAGATCMCMLLWLEQWFRVCVTYSVTCVQTWWQECLELVQLQPRALLYP
jgi:hypothetical protein